MITKPKFWFQVFTVSTLSCMCLISNAQFTLSGQVRTRTELRDGQGAPLPKTAKSAFFTSQRSRLTAGYSTYRLKFGLTLQDVRVWGQDGSTINRTTTPDNNGIMLHEAWAEIGLTDTSNKKAILALKLGRQELSYDDQRLLGGLDWLQQARRHDAAVLKLDVNKFTLHGGFAFNQNKESGSGTIYNSTPAGNYGGNTNGGSIYKSLEYVYAGYKLKTGSISYLFLADQFSKYHTDAANNAKVWDNGSWGRITTGFYLNNNFKDLNVTAAAYYQGGKSATGQKISGALFSAAGSYNFSKKFAAGPGIDVTTGGSKAGKSNAFDPLYGTPHKFWGYMDYFYVASGFGQKGLVNYYLKTKYKPSASLLITADLHQFASASTILDATNNKLSRNFGTEADLIVSYSLTKIIGFEAGYSHFFSTSSLSATGVKNVTNAQSNNNWAFLSINIKPDFIK